MFKTLFERFGAIINAVIHDWTTNIITLRKDYPGIYADVVETTDVVLKNARKAAGKSEVGLAKKEILYLTRALLAHIHANSPYNMVNAVENFRADLRQDLRFALPVVQYEKRVEALDQLMPQVLRVLDATLSMCISRHPMRFDGASPLVSTAISVGSIGDTQIYIDLVYPEVEAVAITTDAEAIEEALALRASEIDAAFDRQREPEAEAPVKAAGEALVNTARQSRARKADNA